jgi:hypothetical protein
MISQQMAAEERPEETASIVPLVPCQAFYTGDIWTVVSELTSLLFDKRIPNT